MTIDFNNFTPIMSLIGGIMIGGAALTLMAFSGRIMGISGILISLTKGQHDKSERSWRMAFILGSVIGPFLVMLFTGSSIEIRPVAQGPVLMLGGLIVGLGAAIGSGCTSGHGICGLARLSKRSFIAVMVFMATAILTVAVIRHDVMGALL